MKSDRELSDLTPYQVWRRQASKLIDDLPAEGATIVVLTNAIGRDIKSGIRELRGIALARRCRMISINRLCDCDKVNGVIGLVVIDSSLHRHTGRHKDILIATVQGLVAAINAMRP